jgi:hypothetical protein
MYKTKGNRGIWAGVLLFILANLGFAFFQHYQCVLDGDMAQVILPTAPYVHVLHDPFGLDVLLKGEHYRATNRFVLHWSIWKYFRTVPQFFQHFTNPIDSVYLACALAKTTFQVSLLYVLSVYISGSYKILNRKFLLAALLLTPLFQTCGYVWDIGIIDPPISYAFSYAYSVLLLAIFFLPFFMKTFHKKDMAFGLSLKLFLMCLSWAIAFNGPVSAPVIIIACGFFFMEQFRQGMIQNVMRPYGARIKSAVIQIQAAYFQVMGFAVFMAFYSFYIGKNNFENFAKQVPLLDRYAKLPASIYGLFTTEGMGMLLTMILVNLIFLMMNKSELTNRIVRLFVWITLFSFVYLMLLPLGGYRFYRPEIARRDVLVPVITALIAFYALSTYYLLPLVKQQQHKLYLFLVIIPLVRFSIADKLYNQFDNSCEKEGMRQIATSKEKIILLDVNCNILEWGKITDYSKSKANADLMRYWGITKEEKYYYQK